MVAGRIDSENGGNLAGISQEWFSEGALQVRINYLDTSGAEQQWYHGFYYSDIENPDSSHFTKVSKRDYFWYIGPDMMEFKNMPSLVFFNRKLYQISIENCTTYL